MATEHSFRWWYKIDTKQEYNKAFPFLEIVIIYIISRADFSFSVNKITGRACLTEGL